MDEVGTDGLTRRFADPQRYLPVLMCLGLAACQPGNGQEGVTADTSVRFTAIGENETIQLLGNEPFWNARISGGSLRYSTPENMDGTVIAVDRFAGLGGLSYSGTFGQERFDVAMTEEACSDTMSERTYPFTAILKIGSQTLRGCGWTTTRPFEERGDR